MSAPTQNEATPTGKRFWARLLSSPTRGDEPVDIGPNWFASVMGTGIVAVAAKTLPVTGPVLDWIAIAFWVIAVGLLIVVGVAFVTQIIRRPASAHGHLNDGMMAQFYGAPPMAVMTVGTGTLLVAPPLIGETASVTIAAILWIIGTVFGLATAVIVPFLLFTRFTVRPDSAFGGWLMPVVPPMVSAAGGALLIPHVPEGELRTSMLYACYTMFGLSLIAALIIITMIWSRLAHYGSSGSVRVPTLWIVLGPLGQSITAAGALGTVAILAVPPDLAQTMNAMAIIYGVPVWGFAGLWSCLAALLTIRAYRRHLSFALTWWAFTFPVGTCVTGTSQLAKHTGLTGFTIGAIAGFILLLAAWAAVGLQTTNRSWRGTLLHKQPAKTVVSSKD